jgi:hypothetical protein
MLRKKFLFAALLFALCATSSMAQYSERTIVKPGRVIAYETFSFTVPATGGALQKSHWSFEKNTIEEIIMFSRPNSPEFRLRTRAGDGSLSWLATITLRKPRTALSAADYMEKWAKGVAFKPYPTSNNKNSCVEIELLDDKKTGQEGFFLTSLLCYQATTDQIVDLSFSEVNTLSRPPDDHFKKAVVDLFTSFKLN